MKSPDVRAVDDEVVELVPDLPAEDLDVRLRRADRRTEIGHRELAFYLAEMHDRGVQQMLGFNSALDYACTRLEMGRRTAQELITVGRALNDLPLIDEAFCTGTIRWSRVRLLVRIAVPETERQWLERATSTSWVEFDREVATSERGRPPRPDRRGLPRVRITVRGRLERVPFETWEMAKRRVEDERGERMTDAQMMAHAASVLLAAPASSAGHCGERAPDSNYRVVVQHCPACEKSSIKTPEGLEEIDEATAAFIRCDAPAESPEGHDHHDSKTPPAMRRKVLLRDGLACLACRSRQGLMAHHIVWSSRGGRTKPSNLATMCSRCHALVHDDLLIVRGEAPNRLSFFDRHGAPIPGAAPLCGPKIARIRMSAPAHPTLSTAPVGPSARAAASDAIAAGAAPEVLLSDIPGRLRHDEWMEVRHLFTWSESAGEFHFRQGERAPEVAAKTMPARSGEAVLATPSARPGRLADVIGQESAVRSLRVAARAAAITHEPVDHVLLLGQPGLGKTTLATALAAEVGTRGHVTSGTMIRDPGVLIRILCGLSDRDVLFVDEIHALPTRVKESLYEALEDGRISVTVTDGHASKAIQITLPKVTIVGATTEIDRLPDAFVSRFPIREWLEGYAESEIAEIVSRAVAREGLSIEAGATADLARAARGTARHALLLVRRARNEVVAAGAMSIDREAVQTALRAAGYDQDGLNALERGALEVLRAHGRPMGAARWAAAAKMTPATLRRMCEPELIRRGLVEVSPKGRVARAQSRAAARGPTRYEQVGESAVHHDHCRDALRLSG